jgi:hypothetical protein
LKAVRAYAGLGDGLLNRVLFSSVLSAVLRLLPYTRLFGDKSCFIYREGSSAVISNASTGIGSVAAAWNVAVASSCCE